MTPNLPPSPVPPKSRPFPVLSIAAVAGGAILLIVLLVTVRIALRNYLVPTSSMEPTLLVGDHVMVRMLPEADGSSRSTAVRRGDVVIFKFPPRPTISYAKRVIGLPGDHIRIENKNVILNGRKLDEPYTRHIDPNLAPYRDNFPSTPVNLFQYKEFVADMLENHVDRNKGELVVPSGSYFVLGDNRDNSLDSRYHGLIPRANIVGRAYEVAFSHEIPEGGLTTLRGDMAMHLTAKFRSERWMMPIPDVEIK